MLVIAFLGFNRKNVIPLQLSDTSSVIYEFTIKKTSPLQWKYTVKRRFLIYNAQITY